MITDLTTEDSFKGRLQTFLQERPPVPQPKLPLKYHMTTGLAPTFIISRVDGGVGASMLALMLSLNFREQPLIIQVGGMKSWAYRELPQDYFVHIKLREEEDPIAGPLDRRLNQGERIAIIEYEQALPVEAITTANYLTDKLDGYAMLFLIADKNDQNFKLLQTAMDMGVESVIGLRKHAFMQRQNETLLQIPSVPSAIAAKLQAQPSSFAHALRCGENPIAIMHFRERLDAFFAEIARSMS